MPLTELDLYIGSAEFNEWVLVLQDPNSVYSTIYTTQCGPVTHNGFPGPYKHYKKESQRFDALGLEAKRLICTIAAEDKKAVDKAARKIEPISSQLYVVAVLARLEQKGLAWKGMSRLYAKLVDPAVRVLDVESRLVRMCCGDTSRLSLFV